jgi:hypothetical protein
MIKKLQAEVSNWQTANTTLKAIPALQYIVITAQKVPY